MKGSFYELSNESFERSENANQQRPIHYFMAKAFNIHEGTSEIQEFRLITAFAPIYDLANSRPQKSRHSYKSRALIYFVQSH